MSELHSWQSYIWCKLVVLIQQLHGRTSNSQQLSLTSRWPFAENILNHKKTWEAISKSQLSADRASCLRFYQKLCREVVIHAVKGLVLERITSICPLLSASRCSQSVTHRRLWCLAADQRAETWWPEDAFGMETGWHSWWIIKRQQDYRRPVGDGDWPCCTSCEPCVCLTAGFFLGIFTAPHLFRVKNIQGCRTCWGDVRRSHPLACHDYLFLMVTPAVGPKQSGVFGS